MNKIAIVFLVLVAIAFAADSEKQIDNCNKDEIEMRTWRVSCKTSLANYRAALVEKTKYDQLYFSASKSYDFAVGEFVVAEKEEHLRLAEKTAATSVYNLARKQEDALCNNLVRNVDPKTPCARLLNRARKNNRLIQCRAAKVTLTQSEKILSERTTIYNTAFRNKESKLAIKIAKLKIREEANAIRLQKQAIFELRLSSKTVTCTKFRDLRARFYGSNPRKFDATNGKFGYRAFKVRLSWDDAEKYCAKRRGHLISIHNDFENTLSRRLCGAGENVPIGYYRYRNGQFSWSDGSSNDYTRWNSGEPNNANVGEPFGEEYTAGGATDKWNDIHKRDFGCFVCKFQIRRK